MYEASVGPDPKALKSIEGRQEGDPRKIADLIVQLANRDEVPLRLISGCRCGEMGCNRRKLHVRARPRKWAAIVTVSNGLLKMQNRFLKLLNH